MLTPVRGSHKGTEVHLSENSSNGRVAAFVRQWLVDAHDRHTTICDEQRREFGRLAKTRSRQIESGQVRPQGNTSSAEPCGAVVIPALSQGHSKVSQCREQARRVYYGVVFGI
jgi:hypothetical protein